MNCETKTIDHENNSAVNKKTKKRLKHTSIYLSHWPKFIGRSLLFIAAVVVYVLYRVDNTLPIFKPAIAHPALLCVWLVFMVETILRFFPSKHHCTGCQKQYEVNYIPRETARKPKINRGVLAIAIVWLLGNAVPGVLHLFGVLDTGILILMAFAYSVCDLICILFFCPFHTWFMKNKCCTTCRIYNWDYPMMFTPFLFIFNLGAWNFFTWSLLGVSLVLLVQWEIMAARHPERFAESTNAALQCANCNEKLCQHKPQLRAFLKKHKNEVIR